MKKFLLLFVGVLFALSAKADWTFYVDISGTDWTEAPYFYVGHDETFFEAKQCERTPVKNQIYKVTFKDWGDLVELYICKSKLVNTTCTKAQIEAAGNANEDWFGKFATNAGNAEYGFNSNNTMTPLFKLTKGTGGASITVNYDPNATDPDPSEDVYTYKYSGADTNWSSKEVEMTANEDGTFSITRTFTKGNAFGVREFINGTAKAWWWGTDENRSISSVNTTYNAGKQGTDNGGNWTFNMETGEYTLTFNPTAKTIVFTSTATPTVETAYTIYFDAVRSGSAWANPHLTLGGVEVIGVADGSLIKYAFNAAEGDAIAFSNGSDPFTPGLVNNTVYYVDKNAIASASKTGYKYSPTHEFTYDVWGQIDGKDWGSTPMTYFPDGTWRTAAINFAPLNKDNSKNNFGIRKLDKNGNQYTVNGSNKYGWIWCETADNTMKVGVKSSAKIEADGGTVNWKIDTSIFNGSTAYVLVFDPAKMTIMFINPAVAATATAEPVAGDGVNTLKVSFDIASYYSGAATKFILSNGSFSAGAKVPEGTTTVSFENVPWSANYTLTPQDGAAIPAAIPVTISAPTITEAEYNESKREWFLVPASENDLKHGMLSLQVTTTGSLYYYLPQAICKVDGQVVASNAFWSKNGFTIQIPAFCDLNNGELPNDFSKAVEITYTPVFPFAVGNASTYGLRAYGGDVQTVLGSASTQSKTVTNVNQAVSGVEGVMIEDEEAPVEYFNLQGQRVNGELAPGIYIRRQGSSVTKVRF